MNNISFKAETINGEIIEACCVINKHDRLLLSNEAKAGFWIECKPDTLQIVNKNKQNNKHKNIMKTEIFKNEKSGAIIYEMNGVILYETVNATSNSFDLNNYDDFREFIKDVIIGGGYTDGLVKTIREDGIGRCSIDDAIIFFKEIIKPAIDNYNF